MHIIRTSQYILLKIQNMFEFQYKFRLQNSIQNRSVYTSFRFGVCIFGSNFCCV